MEIEDENMNTIFKKAFHPKLQTALNSDLA
jgi:hypothetical protein